MIDTTVKMVVEILQAMSKELKPASRHVSIAFLGLVISVLSSVVGVVGLVDAESKTTTAILWLVGFTVTLGVMVVTMRVIALGPTKTSHFRQKLVSTYLDALDNSRLNPIRKMEERR